MMGSELFFAMAAIVLGIAAVVRACFRLYKKIPPGGWMKFLVDYILFVAALMFIAVVLERKH